MNKRAIIVSSKDRMLQLSDFREMEYTSLWLIETAKECGCTEAIKHLNAVHKTVRNAIAERRKVFISGKEREYFNQILELAKQEVTQSQTVARLKKKMQREKK